MTDIDSPNAHVSVLTADFPRSGAPELGAFVHTLWSQVQAQGSRVSVIAPTRYPITVERSGNERGLAVRRPGYFSPGVAAPFAQKRRKFSQQGWIRAAEAAVDKHDLPDWFFGQFLLPAGHAATVLGDRFDRPSFVEISENHTGLDGWVYSHSTAEIRKILHSFTGIIAVSEVLATMLTEDFGVDSDRVVVSRNGVDHELFSPAPPRHDVADNASRGAPLRTITVARHEHVKGVQVVADAVGMVPDVTGVFVGNGPHPPQGDRLELCGGVPHHDVPQYLRSADAFVLPSTSEGCANAVLEAMSVGLPIIVSDRPFMREIADPSFATFVEPDSSDQIAEAIADLASDPQRREERGRKAREAAMAFSIEDRAKTLMRWMASRSGLV